MKYVSLLISIVLLSACAKNEALQKVIFSGQIENKKEGKVFLVPSENFVGFKDYVSPIDSFDIDTNGNFSFTFLPKNTDLSFYELADENGFSLTSLPIALTPGDSVFLLENTLNNEYKYKLSGNGAHLLAYNIYERIYHKIDLNENWEKINYKLPEDSFSLLMQEKWSAYQALFIPYFDSIAYNGPVKTLIEEHLALKHVDNYYKYLSYHNYYATDSFYYKLDYAPSFLDFAKQFDNKEPLMPASSRYLNFIDDKVEFIMQQKPEYHNLEWDKQMPAKWEITKTELNGNALNAGIFNVLNKFTYGMGEAEAYNVLDEAQKLATEKLSEAQLQIFNDKYNKYTALKPGSPAPNFSLPNNNGEIVNLSDYKGKVIYIDFWGTWCMPCLREIPMNHELLDKFENHPDFVMLSVALEGGETEIARWKSFISGTNPYPTVEFLDNYDLSRGNHVVAQNQFANKEIAAYMVNFAPTYVLINKDFTIANPRAPRPKEAMEIIEKMLKN